MTTVRIPCDAGTLIVEGDYDAGDPGRTSGPPERCYPPEPAYFDLMSLKLQLDDGPTIDFADLPQDLFPDEFWDNVAELAQSYLEESEPDWEPDPEPDYD